MNREKAVVLEPIDNVISLRGRHKPEHRLPHSYSSSDNFLTVRRRPHKEDVEVVSKVNNKETVSGFTRKNNPGEYNSYRNMKQRCKEDGYVLDPRFGTFRDFMQHIGTKPGKDYTLDRIDHNNPEYSPENCRWARKLLQTWNRSNTVMLTDNTGTSLPVAEWSIKVGLPAKTIHKRRDRGYSEHDAIHLPKGYRRRKSQAAQHPVANCDELTNLFEQKLRDVHKQGFICTQPKNKKNLKDISRNLEAGGVPSLPALALVLDEWAEFRVYADKKYGAFNPPEIPTTEYLSRALLAIGNFYHFHLQQMEEATAKQQRQALLEKPYAMTQQAEQRSEFINDYLNKNPEHKRLTDRLAWLESGKDQPDYGMELKHYIEYAPFWFFLHSFSDGSAEKESPEQWAERAIANTTQGWPRMIWQQLTIDTKGELQTLLREKGLQKQAEKACRKHHNTLTNQIVK